MANGCGPSIPNNTWYFRCINFIYEPIRRLLFDWFHEASCNRHDEGYEEGGDEVRRFECDWKFYQAMKRDSLRQKSWRQFIRFSQAMFFFALVRSFGWLIFNYTDKK